MEGIEEWSAAIKKCSWVSSGLESIISSRYFQTFAIIILNSIYFKHDCSLEIVQCLLEVHRQSSYLASHYLLVEQGIFVQQWRDRRTYQAQIGGG